MSSDSSFCLSEDDSEFEIENSVQARKAANRAGSIEGPRKAKKPKRAAVTKTKAKKKKQDPVLLDESDEEFEIAPGKAGSGHKGRNSLEKAALSSRYQKKSQLEHILLRADVYIGSPDKTEEKCWVYDMTDERLVYKKISYAPGLYKIVDEILVNAADNKQRDQTMKYIKVKIDPDTGVISVKNDGRGIPVEIHGQHKIYIPELIFGHLLTGENFEDSVKRVVGGKNGYGAKLANIFSQWFQVETVDSKAGKKYVQRWCNNMTECKPPKITKAGARDKDYTQISFLPDYGRFGSKELELDTYSLLCKRVHDIAGVTHRNLKVELNGKKLEADRFEKYVDLYIEALGRQATEKTASSTICTDSNAGPDPIEQDEPEGKNMKVYEKVNDFWEICITKSPGVFGHVSFVNTLCTYKGGKHVDYISDMVVKHIAEKLQKDKDVKGLQINNNTIKSKLFVFVNCLVINPTFDSQSKNYLATPASKFGEKKNLPVLSDTTKRKLSRSDVIADIKAAVENKNLKNLSRKTKINRNRPLGIEKLDDANKAGGKDWKKCTLILTEGDSAKSLAVAGLSVIGKDYYGVFPLKGKLLNVRDANHKQIMANTEIQNICKIVGLMPGKPVDVSEFKKTTKARSKAGLRYGSIMVMTDQDHDGSHIKGLLFNFIHFYWPELMRNVSSFLQVFITPIVKCTPRAKSKKQVFHFYTMPEYKEWYEENKAILPQYSIKYYKGLGTSNSKEAKEYFRNLKQNRIKMMWDKPEHLSDNALKLAFSKKLAGDRKKWLEAFNQTMENSPREETFIDFNASVITYSTFVNKELIQFSLADNIRSIPNVVDGLKPSQRKVLFACMKKFMSGANYSYKEVKVAQFAGYVSEQSAYHHGEASLVSTIVNLAQNFVGSNNINFLRPEGQFGTRLSGGKDAASGRYIYTGISRLLTKTFRAEDRAVLNYLQEEGLPIEPEYYVPIVPVILINGAQGIGTGWSTEVPMYNPTDIVQWLRRRIDQDENGGSGSDDEENPRLYPWYRGFSGTIIQTKENQFTSRGVFDLQKDMYADKAVLHITELPVGKWTNDYKAFLMKLNESTFGGKEMVKEVVDTGTEEKVTFKVSLDEQLSSTLLERDDLVLKTFKLEKTLSTSNMHLFDSEHKIRKFDHPEAVLEEFFRVRLATYHARKAQLLKTMETDLEKLKNEERFVHEVASGKISILRRKKADLEEELQKKGYRRLAKASQANKEEEEEGDTGKATYGYLLTIPILNLTMEKVQQIRNRLEKEQETYRAYKKKTVHSMWQEELAEFFDEYNKFLVTMGCSSTTQETKIPERFRHARQGSGEEAATELASDLATHCQVTSTLKREAEFGDKLASAGGKKPKIAQKKPSRQSDASVSSGIIISDDEEPVETKQVEERADKVSSQKPKPVAPKRPKKIKKRPARRDPDVCSVDSSISELSSDTDVSSVEPTTREHRRREARRAKPMTSYDFNSSDSNGEANEGDSEYVISD